MSAQETPAAPDDAKKKPYHNPEVRDFGTVKDLTLTGGGGPPDSQLEPDYATGGVN